MRERNINTAVVALLLLFIMFSFGCGKKTDTNTITLTQFCTVQTVNNEALISCPDGSSVTLPPQIINETIETVIEVPVIIQIPKNRCNNGHHDKVERCDRDGHHE